MSRPLRFAFSTVLLAGTLGFSGCIGTIYDNTYSYRKNHFKPPQEKKEASAESILSSLDRPAGQDSTGGGALPPATEVPGLPPAGLPDPNGALPPPAPAAPAQ